MQSKTKVFQALSVGALAVSLFAGIIAGFLIFFFLSGCSAKLDHDTPRQVGVPIFDQGIETPDLKAFATSDGGTIWVRLEAATPGGLLYVWDTSTGKGDLWAFNKDLLLVKMEGSSARNWGTWQASSTLVKLDRHADAKPETGILTAEYLEQQQRHIDGHRLHAEDCKVPDFTLSDAYSFTATEAAGDFTVDLRDLKHCSDRSHNALVDILQSGMVEF